MKLLDSGQHVTLAGYKIVVRAFCSFIHQREREREREREKEKDQMFTLHNLLLTFKRTTETKETWIGVFT